LLRENIIRRNQEHFWVVGLNNANKILFIELVSLGAAIRVQIDPPEVFRMAIYKSAVKIILVHNHSSGEITESTADREFTDRMLKVGEIIRVEVIDHLVISDTVYSSFERKGNMEKLRRSDSWRIVAKEEAEIKELKLEIEKEKSVKNEKVDVARKLKAEGMSDEFIKKVTGLKLNEIKKL
jgi:DNA repair protein RadC